MTFRLIDWLMPVGHIIESKNANFDPNKLYVGTTWVKIEGRFTLGSGTGYSVGDTGGEAEHTLVVGEMPIHSHGQYVTGNSGGPAVRRDYNVDGSAWTYPQGVNTDIAGGGQPHNNMPPYLVVNKWVRTE